jgi:hypothetical protein
MALARMDKLVKKLMSNPEELVYWGVWQNYKGSLGEGGRPCIKNRKGVWEREMH